MTDDTPIPAIHRRSASIDELVAYRASQPAAARTDAKLDDEMTFITSELPLRCGAQIRNSVPSWAGSDQIDPCECVLALKHGGEHKCSHVVEPSAAHRTQEGHDNGEV